MAFYYMFTYTVLFNSIIKHHYPPQIHLTHSTLSQEHHCFDNMRTVLSQSPEGSMPREGTGGSGLHSDAPAPRTHTILRSRRAYMKLACCSCNCTFKQGHQAHPHLPRRWWFLEFRSSEYASKYDIFPDRVII